MTQQICKECGNPLVCSACKGKKGGNTSKKRYTKAQRAAWGRKGGRPKKSENETDVVWQRETKAAK